SDPGVLRGLAAQGWPGQRLEEGDRGSWGSDPRFQRAEARGDSARGGGPPVSSAGRARLSRDSTGRDLPGAGPAVRQRGTRRKTVSGEVTRGGLSLLQDQLRAGAGQGRPAARRGVRVRGVQLASAGPAASGA